MFFRRRPVSLTEISFAFFFGSGSPRRASRSSASITRVSRSSRIGLTWTFSCISSIVLAPSRCQSSRGRQMRQRRHPQLRACCIRAAQHHAGDAGSTPRNAPYEQLSNVVHLGNVVQPLRGRLPQVFGFDAPRFRMTLAEVAGDVAPPVGPLLRARRMSFLQK